jgi:hypothetical protein
LSANQKKDWGGENSPPQQGAVNEKISRPENSVDIAPTIEAVYGLGMHHLWP